MAGCHLRPFVLSGPHEYHHRPLADITFRVLYVFLVLRHDRRRVVHFNVTTSPTARWAAQQIVEAFPFEDVWSQYSALSQVPWWQAVCRGLGGVDLACRGGK